MPNFEDVRLCDLLNKVSKRVNSITVSKNVSEFNALGAEIQAVYDFFVTAQKDYAEQQPMLKNLFSSFNYAAVIINDAIKTKKPDGESGTLLTECLEIISACCNNIKK
ncbi:MAG: hypothetical protein K2J61_00730, partial [Clostridia bacterium]|nr:hypothetical protein [Clostridia bacterium]